MLGRLARYLRFMGHDTAYAQSRSDAEIAAWAVRDARTLLTRDRALAHRVAGALLLASPALADQLRAVRAAYPDLDYRVRFTRCTRCNGSLAPLSPDPGAPAPAGVPVSRWTTGQALFRCAECGHVYWEGSHAAGIRTTLDAVFRTA